MILAPAGDAAAGRPGGASERGRGQGYRSVRLHKSAGRQLYARGVEAVRADGVHMDLANLFMLSNVNAGCAHFPPLRITVRSMHVDRKSVV